MALPAMQGMREMSRRSLCQQRLAGLSLGLSAHVSRHLSYPAGTQNESGPIVNTAEGNHHNWIASILPHLDAQNVANAIDDSVGVYDSANDEVRSLRLPMLICPSASSVADNTTCYAGSSSSIETPIDADNDGMFFLNSGVRDSDITDGLSYTLFVGEKLSRRSEDLGWISGTRSSLRTTGIGINVENQRIRGPQKPGAKIDDLYVGGFSSDHPGGAYLLMGDGSVRYRSDTVDLATLQQMASRADGEIPTAWKTDALDGVKPKRKDKEKADAKPEDEPKAESNDEPADKSESNGDAKAEEGSDVNSSKSEGTEKEDSANKDSDNKDSGDEEADAS